MTNLNDTIVFGHGGGMYSVVPEGANPTKLMPGTYGIQYDDMSGYRLTTLPDLQEPAHRVYGRQDAVVAKVIATYGKFDRSLGVLFAGDKGIGKSSTTMELARQARDIYKLPVIMVTHNTPGLATFLGTLGECVVVMDEFEKNFPANYEDRSNQDQFLSLFDGTDSVKRLYMVTVNDSSQISPYFLNRPGRFHYLINFDYPTQDDIRDYLTHETNGNTTEEQISEVASFAQKARLNYDHLRAIVTELANAPAGAEIGELLADLNIRNNGDGVLTYNLLATFGDARLTNASDVSVNLFSRSPQLVTKSYSGQFTDQFLKSLGYELSDIMHSRTILTFRGQDVDSQESGILTINPQNLEEGSMYLVECYEKIDLSALGISRGTPGVSLHDNDTEVHIQLNPETLAALPLQLSAALMIRSIELTPHTNNHGRFFYDV